MNLNAFQIVGLCVVAAIIVILALRYLV